MSNIVEVAAQIDINYARLILNNCLGYPVYRFMSCPIGSISKRSRLEVRLKDRLQYELERPLHHSIPDSRYREDADFAAAILRYLLPSSRQRHVAAPSQFATYLFEESPHALRLNGLESHPVCSRGAIILFGQRVRLA